MGDAPAEPRSTEGEHDTVHFEPGDFAITTENGDPVVELPSGQVLELRTHVKVEDRLENPLRGRHLDMDIEVDADDYSWWTLFPADDEEPAAVEEIVIEPHLHGEPGDD